MKQTDERHLVAAVSYVLFFITGLAILMAEEEDKFIRFHAFQSVYGFGVLFVAYILVGIIFGVLPFVSFIGDIISFVLLFITFIFWVTSIVKAYRGEIFMWPKIGKIAEKKAG